MADEKVILGKGQFYFIYNDNNSYFILVDKTKRGLEVMDTGLDENIGVNADKGRIYDMNGKGHTVPIKWYFPQDKFSLAEVRLVAEKIESKYRAVRELTCPED